MEIVKSEMWSVQLIRGRSGAWTYFEGLPAWAPAWSAMTEAFRGHSPSSREAPEFLCVWADCREALDAEIVIAVREAEEKWAARAEEKVEEAKDED